MVIMVNALTVLAMIPFGAQIASSVFVGNCLGEGKPRKAKVYQLMITSYTFVICAIFSALLVLYKEWVAALFTNDLQLLTTVIGHLKWIALFLTVHGIGMSLGGALRGMGKSNVATKLIFAGFFLIGHPLSIILCFYVGMGIVGITIGFIIGSFSMGFLVYVSTFCFSDWEEISQQVRKRHLVDGADQIDEFGNSDLKQSLMNHHH